MTFVTADSVDPLYTQPYVDVNELRDAPVPHRYVHGGFKGTDARFSFYFPPAEQYQRRFFHNTYPLATSEDVGPFPIAFNVATGDIGFTIGSGAYYVQTNLGGHGIGGDPDPTILAYRVNAAAAKYSRVVAADLYGLHRPYGYIFGGSGGSYQVMGAAENTSGVWDGFLPFVMGTPYSIPSMFTVRLHALRILRQRNKLPAVMDAVNPGGSGDMYAGLNDEERDALVEATRLGYPPRGWWNHASLNSGYLCYNIVMLKMRDPTYAEDFWSKPGYLGTDPKSSIRGARVQFETTVAKAADGKITFAETPPQDFADADLHILSGAAAGKNVALGPVSGNPMSFAVVADPRIVGEIKPGDSVRIDNSWALALQTYQRHQLPPSLEFAGWNQYRGADGKPLYPQREMLIGTGGAISCAGTVPVGRVSGKTLALEVLMDIDALPWQADWYRSAAKRELGGRFDEDFAIWFIDHAQHDDPPTAAAHAHTVSFGGALQQGLRDLARWAETGVKPAETNYTVTDCQVHVPASAKERGGIQATVELRANGDVRADVKAGATVSFAATIEAPPGAGKVVDAEWDFEGLGTYPVKASVAPQERVELSATHAYAKPGTYFAVLRAASQREGDAKTPYGRVQNLARVRVVVT